MLGGVAVLAGLGVTVVAAAAGGAMDDSLESIALVSIGLSVLCAVGVIDDTFNVPAGWKLLAQIFSTIPMILAGCAIDAVSLFGLEVPLGPVGSLVTIAWFVACTNAVNLIDGMDGLCSTVGLCVAAGVTAASCLAGADNTVVCAAALAGSLAGFLIYNLPPASIYLGDAGSMVIGMVLAVLTLHVAQDHDGATRPMVMISLMALPLGDVALAMIRRRLSGKRIFQADRGHIHHRMLDHGLKIPQVLVAVASICVATGIVGVGTDYSGNDLVGAVALAAVLVVLINRRLVGHYEWSLVRAIVARRAAESDEALLEGAPTIVRFDSHSTPTLRTHASKSASNDVNAQERRRAA
jgi:UDP-GlcNAc:undecaprenyl-phosphate GlcNAc-1-phosphate transferase